MKSKTSKFLIWVIIFLILNMNSIYGQPGDDMPPNREAGKCYSKCLMPSKYNRYTETYFIYTNSTKNINEENIESIDLYKYEDKETIQKIVWKNRIEELNSIDDPLIKEESSFENNFDVSNLKSIIDTTGVTDFEIIEVTYREISRERSETEWREVICRNKLNSKLIKSLRNSLKNDGYLIDDWNSGTLDENLKEKLREYQRDYELPIGQIDIETLEHMNIKY